MKNILISISVLIFVTLFVFFVLLSFSDDYENVLESYCGHSGGKVVPLENLDCAIGTDCNFWNCVYPDGTRKSKEEISWMFNSTI